MNYIRPILIFSIILNFAYQLQAQEIYTWDDCLKEAKVNHPDLISAREEINQSKADLDSSTSGLLPQVDADLNYSSSRSATSKRSESYSYGLSGSQLLFDGFKTTNERRQSKEILEATKFSYMVVSSEVRLRLRNAFIDVLKENQLLSITDSIVKRRQDSLELVKLRYEAGREHKGALLQAEANLAEAQADALDTQRNLQVSQRRLSKEMGRTQFQPLDIQGTVDIADVALVQPEFEQLSETTPLLKELISRKEASRFGMHSAKADFFPSIYADADIGRSGSNWSPKDESSSIGVRVSLPIFDGGDRRASLKKAKATFRKSQADERSGRDDVILTLHQTWANFQNAVDQVNVQSKFLESAQARSKIGEAQYSNGLISFDDWIIIEDTLVRAEKSFIEAQAQALSAKADWVQAKGGTVENEN